MPETDDEVGAIKGGFNRLGRMRGIIGCVDGTLFKIVRPRGEADQPYVCRKGFTAINAMVICDDRKKFIALHAGPGRFGPAVLVPDVLVPDVLVSDVLVLGRFGPKFFTPKTQPSPPKVQNQGTKNPKTEA
jgi:hypothetical protein